MSLTQDDLMNKQSSAKELEEVIVDEKEMVNMVGLPDKLWFRTIERTLSVLASLAVVAGIWFAIYQVNLSNTIEKRRVAVEAIGQTRSAEFLKDYRNVKTAYQTKQIESKEKVALVDSLNHVMNVYDHIAILYISNIADKCIIKNSIYSGAKEMSAICDSMSYPSEYRSNFNILLILMDQEYCDSSGLNPTASK